MKEPNLTKINEDRQIELKPGERIDDLQRNNLKIIQDSARFCFGMDAVLLSGFAKAGIGSRVLDMGTGNGIIPILMSAKTQAEHFTGLEIQNESADMALRSVILNKLENRISIVKGDIKEAAKLFGAASFDVITSNPPYMTDGRGLKNPDEPRAIARHEILCTLDDVIVQSEKLLKTGGKLYLVHRPFRLTEIMTKLHDHRLEPKRMIFVYPFVDHEPTMVLIEATKGGRSGITIEKPLIIYEQPGKYTREIYEIYGY